MTGPERTIFHICRREEWDAAVPTGAYGGSSQDAADGFIHFSTADQVVASAAKHRAGQRGLVLVEAAVERLGESLKWEPSRPGMLFPHLHGRMAVWAAVRIVDLPLGPDGRHVFPPDLARMNSDGGER
ncbi:MAG: DUF952 domain-containing protein [Pseudomonadota bacterium]